MSRILVTGGNGFVGLNLCPALVNAGHHVRITTRTEIPTANTRNIEAVVTGDIGIKTNWTPILENIDFVVHLAGRAHVMRETHLDPLKAFQQTNVEGTKYLAEAAAQQGIKRFIFMSSVKALGERTGEKPLQETDTPSPEDAYGKSKFEAEQALRVISQTTNLETVILRPPLIYGPHVKGNFKTLLKACSKKIPLPLGAVDNQRSLIFVGNLVDAISQCLAHDNAAGHTFLLRDDINLSSKEMVQNIAQALDVPARLIPLPLTILRLAGQLTGKKAMIQRLTESLVVDDSHIRTVLGWKPPYSMVEGMKQTAAWYQSNHAV